MSRKQEILKFLLGTATMCLLTDAFAITCGSIVDTLGVDGCEVNATIPYEGEYGSVTMKAFPASGKTTVTLARPLIVVSPLDASGTSTPNDIYNLIQASYLSEPEFEVVVLNYGSRSADYIQKNAFSMIAALEKVQALRQSSGPQAVIGVSLGGIIARYALAYMEHFDRHHDVQLYVSLDTPHRGAHVPVALQRLPILMSAALSAARGELDNLSDFSDYELIEISQEIFQGSLNIVSNLGTLGYAGIDLDITDLDVYVSQLTGLLRTLSVLDGAIAGSRVAKQLLINHYNPDDSEFNGQAYQVWDSLDSQGADGNPELWQQGIDYIMNNDTSTGEHWLRRKFVKELAELGDYPKQPIKTAVTFGSVNGTSATKIAPRLVQSPYQNDTLLTYSGSTDIASFRFHVGESGPGKPLLFGEIKGPSSDLWKGDEVYYREMWFGRASHSQLDYVPGSGIPWFSILINEFNKATGSTFGKITGSELLQNEYFTFVPTFSALDIETSDPNENLLARSGNKLVDITPFDRVIYNQNHPSWNGFHTFTDPNAKYALYSLRISEIFSAIFMLLH